MLNEYTRCYRYYYQYYAGSIIVILASEQPPQAEELLLRQQQQESHAVDSGVASGRHAGTLGCDDDAPQESTGSDDKYNEYYYFYHICDSQSWILSREGLSARFVAQDFGVLWSANHASLVRNQYALEDAH